MNRADRRRRMRLEQRGARGGLPVIHTSPGCETDMHRQEVIGATMALAMRGPWKGSTLMDCGCVLRLELT